MLIKVFKHGQGYGNAPVDYLLSHKYPGRDKHPPEILRGNANMTIKLINSINNKWKYTAGVLSWHPDDIVSPAKEKQLMDDFEKLAFAGLDPDQYNIFWVRHQHAAHHELHFVIPRVELESGKAYNPCPPGWQKDYDPLRDLYNYREAWARPDDPDRARLYVPDHADLHCSRLKRWGKTPSKDERAQAKQAIHDYLRQMLEQGFINNRDDVIATLQNAGLKINRQGKDYITVTDPDSNEKLRLKGGIYAQQWLGQQYEQYSPTHETGSRATAPGAGEDDSATVQRLERQLEQIIKRRADYNRRRYPGTSYQLGTKHSLALPRPQLDIRQTMAANAFNQRRDFFGHYSGRMGIIRHGPEQDSELIKRDFRSASGHDSSRARLSGSDGQIQGHQPDAPQRQRLSDFTQWVQSGNRLESGQQPGNTNIDGQVDYERNTTNTQTDLRQSPESSFRQTERAKPDTGNMPAKNNNAGAIYAPSAKANQPDQQRAARIRSKLRTYERYTQGLRTIVNKIEFIKIGYRNLNEKPQRLSR